MLGCPVHDPEDRLDEFVGNGFVEQVAHGVHENKPGRPPREGLFQNRLVDGDLEAISVFFKAHGLEPSCHSLGVTMLAPGTDLATTRHRVPGDVGPFYARISRHPYKCSRMCFAILVAGPIPRGLPTQNMNSNSAVFVEFLKVFDVFRNLLPNRVVRFLL